jgi:polygalacturonase
LNGLGKTLYIPRGEYLTDEIVIHNCKALSIYLDADALIRIKTSPTGENVQNRGIWIDHSEEIKIYGRGVLDHQGYENFRDGRNDYHYGFPGYDFYFKFEDIPAHDPFLQSPILITYSKNVSVEGLVIRNSRNYNFNVRHSDHITVRGIKIITPAGSVPENTDGINVGSVQDMLIDNCLVYCNDDPFAFGHNLLPYDNRSVKNLTIRKMTGWNPRANGVRLGWAFNNYADRILFTDCHFSGMDDSAILIHRHQHDNHQSEDSLCYGTIRFEDCTFDDVAIETRPMIDVQGASIKSLELVRVTFDAMPKYRSIIIGGENMKIGRLLFENVTVGGVKVSKEHLNMEVKEVENLIIK